MINFSVATSAVASAAVLKFIFELVFFKAVIRE
jgi:hypothetical protein